MMSIHTFKKIAVIAVFLCAGCADMDKTAELPVVHASAFIYDPSAKPVEAAAFVYDPSAPTMRASRFSVSDM